MVKRPSNGGGDRQQSFARFLNRTSLYLHFVMPVCVGGFTCFIVILFRGVSCFLFLCLLFTLPLSSTLYHSLVRYARKKLFSVFKIHDKKLVSLSSVRVCLIKVGQNNGSTYRKKREALLIFTSTVIFGFWVKNVRTGDYRDGLWSGLLRGPG
jgi:hypothetical protein